MLAAIAAMISLIFMVSFSLAVELSAAYESSAERMLNAALLPQSHLPAVVVVSAESRVIVAIVAAEARMIVAIVIAARIEAVVIVPAIALVHPLILAIAHHVARLAMPRHVAAMIVMLLGAHFGMRQQAEQVVQRARVGKRGATEQQCTDRGTHDSRLHHRLLVAHQ